MRLAKLGIIICACLLCIWITATTYHWLGTPKAHHTIPRHIQYNFTLQNTTNRLVKEAELWTYGPLKQTPTQQCVKLEASHPFQLILDELGNQILHFTFKNLPPYGSKIITIEADLLLSDSSNPMPVKDTTAYLRAEEYCESDDPEISRLAKKLKGPKPVKTAENIFRWVAGNMEYTGYLREPRGALYALKKKKGDCTEFMYLFAALCRANNIPARCIGGYVCQKNAVLKPNGYHNWVEFFDGGVWNIADPQRNVFMQIPSQYIAMQVIGESPKNPMGNYCRLRCAGDGLKVKMKG
jgi:transglutaminase-like putative cysteine protease